MQNTYNHFKETEIYNEKNGANWLSNKDSYINHREDLISYIQTLEDSLKEVGSIKSDGTGDFFEALFKRGAVGTMTENLLNKLKDLYDQANFIYEHIANTTRGHIVKMSLAEEHPGQIKGRTSYLASLAADMSYLSMKIEKLGGKKYIGKKKNYQPSNKEELMMTLADTKDKK